MSSSQVDQGLIPVYRPELSGNERDYVLDCLDSGWISSIGIYTERFETAFKELTGAAHATVVANGTVALHLALHCLGVGRGDEVIVPTFTYIASVNAIAQTGATPVFVDSRKGDWLVDPQDIRGKITPRTKAIMAVHLYGAICDMKSIMEIARDHGLFVVEDCAEALGSRLNGTHAGNFGDVGTFSFFGNKTITTGEGGMVSTSNEALAARLKKVKGQGQSLDRRYWHDELGFNYRMTNICAAIGLAQIEIVNETLARKRLIANRYRQLLGNEPFEFQHLSEGTESSEWLVSLLLPPNVDRDLVMMRMRERGVDTRPVFYCAHQMPMYNNSERFPVAEEIASRGISLPSFPGLQESEICKTVEVLLQTIPEAKTR